MLTYNMTLRGGITGTMWMPACEGSVAITINLNREESRFTEAPTMRDLILHVLMEHGGDFQNSKMTGDTVIEVTSRKGTRILSHCWPITVFPSVADCVNEDIYSYDFDGDDE